MLGHRCPSIRLLRRAVVALVLVCAVTMAALRVCGHATSFSMCSANAAPPRGMLRKNMNSAAHKDARIVQRTSSVERADSAVKNPIERLLKPIVLSRARLPCCPLAAGRTLLGRWGVPSERGCITLMPRVRELESAKERSGPMCPLTGKRPNEGRSLRAGFELVLEDAAAKSKIARFAAKRLLEQLRILSPRSSEGLQVCGGKLVHGQDNRKDSSTFWLQEGRNTKCVGVEEARAKLHRVQTGSLLKLSVYSAETGPQSAKELTIDGNEAYKLIVPRNGSAMLMAASPLGIAHGFKTLAQLLTLSADDNKDMPEDEDVEDGSVILVVPCVVIHDEPKHSWRGVMIDSARHWMPLSTLRAVIRAASAVKINVFHLHLTDDQAWRFESKSYPKLTKLASDGNFYKQTELRSLVYYAFLHGMRLMPEIDMPSHTTAVVQVYPELAPKGHIVTDRSEIGRRDPTLDPSKTATWRFARAVLTEVANVFDDQYIHLGGDEVSTSWWETDDAIQSWSRRQREKSGGSKDGYWDVSEVQPRITQHLCAILKSVDRTLVGWDEILGPDYGQSLVQVTDLLRNNRTRFRPVIQSWQGEDGLLSGTNAGLFTLRSHGYYLDHLQPTKNHYGVYVVPPGMRADETNGRRHLSRQVENPKRSSKAISQLLHNTQQIRHQRLSSRRGLILGGEACMWTEFVTSSNIEQRVFPRTYAMAEVFWGTDDGRDNNNPNPAQDADMYRRLYATLRLTDGVKITHLERTVKRQMSLLSHGNNTLGMALGCMTSAMEPLGLDDRVRIGKERLGAPASKFMQRKGTAVGTTPAGKYTRFTPLDRIVDVVPPENQIAVDFYERVRLFLEALRERRQRSNSSPQTKSTGDNLKRTTTALRAIILVRLNEWKKCSALLERSAVGSAGNSVLSEAAEAAQRLGAVVSSLTAMIHNPCIVYECVNGPGLKKKMELQKTAMSIAMMFDNDMYETGTVSQHSEVRVAWGLKDALRQTADFVRRFLS